MRAFWFLLGLISIVLGIIGIFLPLLPTVPFLLLAAVGFSKSSQRAHDWLINHPRLGPPIKDWREKGAIRPRAKRLATLCVAAAFGISIWLGVPVYALGLQAAVLLCVLLFIWSRPSG